MAEASRLRPAPVNDARRVAPEAFQACDSLSVIAAPDNAVAAGPSVRRHVPGNVWLPQRLVTNRPLPRPRLVVGGVDQGLDQGDRAAFGKNHLLQFDLALKGALAFGGQGFVLQAQAFDFVLAPLQGHQ